MTSPTPARARPNALKWALIVLGGGVTLIALSWRDLTPTARWVGAIGGAVIMLLSPAAAQSAVASVAVTEEGVTGAGFLRPVHIPWASVVRICDDPQGISVQSATRSARIELSTVTVSYPGGSTRVGNFANPDEMVRFILSHTPKSAVLELTHWLPT